ncbi:hypothetical protein D3C80_2206160 [compost metagenome]
MLLVYLISQINLMFCFPEAFLEQLLNLALIDMTGHSQGHIHRMIEGFVFLNLLQDKLFE